MLLDTETASLPPLYAKWIAELLGGAIPKESRATCDNCAMCPGNTATLGGSGARDLDTSYYFDPNIKCCSYVPDLHNFLVGRILSDTDPAAQPGRASVEQRIETRIGVTPLGLTQSPAFALLYDKAAQAFGQSRTLRCPHYIEQGGRCGIWSNRESTCVTWFCKHVRGAVGDAFWLGALHKLLRTIENDLARWAVLELHPGDDLLSHLVTTAAWKREDEPVTGESLDNRVNERAYARVWGDWRGHEQEFFSHCAELVNPLSWTDVLTISGPSARAYAQVTKQAYSRLLSDSIPPALKAGPMQLLHVRDGVARVSTYNDYDPLDIPTDIMEVLPYFDGRPTEDTLARIADERGLELDLALVRKMVDFDLLIAPKDT